MLLSSLVREFSVLGVLAVLVSCGAVAERFTATQVEKARKKLAAIGPLVPDAAALDESANSVPCEDPKTPAGLSSVWAFKYGCFCGAGHPGLDTPDRSLDENIQEFYRHAPKDDVDAICREHDVCWLVHGQENGACNEVFRLQLKTLSGDWSERKRRPHPGCGEIQRDMLGAFISVFTASSKESFESNVVRGLATAVLPGYEIYERTTGAGYPGRTDYCNRSDD